MAATAVTWFKVGHLRRARGITDVENPQASPQEVDQTEPRVGGTVHIVEMYCCCAGIGRDPATCLFGSTPRRAVFRVVHRQPNFALDEWVALVGDVDDLR